MLNFIKKKYNRLLSSSKILKIKFIFHKYFGEKDIGNIGFTLNVKNRVSLTHVRRSLVRRILDSHVTHSVVKSGKNLIALKIKSIINQR